MHRALTPRSTGRGRQAEAPRKTTRRLKQENEKDVGPGADSLGSNLTGCATSGRPLNLSVPQSPPL